MAFKIVIVGLVVFIAHFLVLLFRKTRIPDVLLLMIGGIIAGPVMGMVSLNDFGAVGAVATTIALIVILFESGVNLKMSTLLGAFGQTMVITLVTYAFTAVVVTMVMHFLTPLPWTMCIMTGAILAGTSSAVVIPLIDGLGMSQTPRTVLFLESAITDVLCIIGAVGMLEATKSGNVDALRIGMKILISFGAALLIGIVAGLVWSFIMGRVRQFPNTIFTTVAWVFLVYGLTEMAGFSGAIAALAVGVTMANLPGIRLSKGDKEFHMYELADVDRLFFAEGVFLLKTFFFIYLGISLQFDKLIYLLVAAAIVVPVYFGRFWIVRGFASRTYEKRDASLMTAMVPKGLAAAVLATLPVQEGLPNGHWIPGVVYMVVLTSICLTAILVLLVEKTPLQNTYYTVFRKFGVKEDATARLEPSASAAEIMGSEGLFAEPEPIPLPMQPPE